MPWSCFSYPADVPPGTGKFNAARSAPPGLHRMPATYCFSYPGDLHPCFSYTTDASAVSGLRRTGLLHCFSYPADAPLGGADRYAAQPALPGLRKMPNICFRY